MLKRLLCYFNIYHTWQYYIDIVSRQGAPKTSIYKKRCKHCGVRRKAEVTEYLKNMKK